MFITLISVIMISPPFCECFNDANDSLFQINRLIRSVYVFRDKQLLTKIYSYSNSRDGYASLQFYGDIFFISIKANNIY